MLVLFMGPSASGKTTLLKQLCEKYGYKPVVRVTTREKRDNEIDGVDYAFVSVQKFKEMQGNNSFVEVEEYSNSRFYATTKESFNISFEDRVCSTITPSGLLQLCLSDLNFDKIGPVLLVNCHCSLKTQILRYAGRVTDFTVSDKLEMCDRLARDEGMFKGVSAVISAAKRINPFIQPFNVDSDLMDVDKQVAD
jgi:hypothetical protein